MPFGVPPELAGLAFFLVGVVLVIESVETFVEAIAESALALGVSGFFLTVLLAGTDLENAVLGLAAVVEGLPDLALGTVFGEALFVLAASLGVAGTVTPFETDVPRTYLLLMLGAPALFFVLALDGTLSQFDGAVLTLAYLPLLGAVYVLESRSGTRYLAAEEVEASIGDDDGDADGGRFDLDIDLDLPWVDAVRERHEGWFRLGVALLATVGMTVGSELAVSGARVVLTAFGLTGLAFGATVMSFVASLEELFLTVEPIRQGRPHLGVGNVAGSTLFFVTANAGVIALVRPIDTGGAVFTVHWPFFLLALGAVAVVLARGTVGRPAGVALLGLYAAYFLAVLGGDLL